MKKLYLALAMSFAATALFAQFNIDAGATNYLQNFNTLSASGATNAWTNNTTLTGWYLKSASLAPAVTNYVAGTGSGNAGAFYSFGIAGTNPVSERALGSVASGTTGTNFIGWRLKNNTGALITSLSVTWTGEQWRKENNASANNLSLSYQAAPTISDLVAGTWTTASSVFTSPIVGATAAAALDGNAPANRTANIVATITVNIPAGEEIMLRWEDLNDAGSDHGLAADDVTVNATIAAAGTPDIALSSPAQIAAGNISQGISNNVIYNFELAVTTAAATLNGVTITTAGTYAASDISNFKVWFSADNAFNAGTDILLSTKATGLAAGSQVFSPFTSQLINSGATGYIFITTDIPCTATVGNTVSVNAVGTADISFVSGNKTGAATAGGTQTIAAGTPINVTGPAASTGNNQSSVSWTNPLGCYDEILIVAASASANTGTPSGDGTAYTANAAFGSGTPLGNGFVVYKGTTSPQTITALSNGTQYFFKIFTRLGSVWSTGVEVSATPANVTVATDYFRSKATGDWNAIATWQSSPDNTSWIDATLVPTTAANTVSIRNGHTVTISIATSLDQVVIESGGILTNTAAVTINDDAGTADDLLIQNGGIFTIAVAGAPGGTGVLRTQTGGILRVSVSGTIQLLQATRFVYDNAAVLEYTLTSQPSASGITYFPNVDVNTIPVFRTTANISGSVGGGGATVINGVLEANGTLNFGGAGTKTFRNGIRGTGNITQGTSGSFIINGTSELGGSGSLTLGAGGLQLTGIINLVSDKIIDGGTVTVSSGVLIGGVFQISGTTNIVINSSIVTAHPNGLSGTLANSGTKVLGPASFVTFNAAGPQQFSTGFNYANVSVTNTGDKILNGPVTITGELQLFMSKIITTAANLLTLDVSGFFTLGSAASYVDGPLQRNTNAATAYTFPVGKAGDYRPFDVIPATAGGSSFVGEYFAPNGNSTSPPCTPARLEAYTSNQYWNVARSSGTDNAAIRLNYNQAQSNGNWTNGTSAMPNPDNTKGITVANYLTATSCWEVYPDVTTLVIGDAATGQPATHAVNSFGDFTFGYSDFAALPITIDYLRGTKQGNTHNLSWKINCLNSPSATMILERSSDAANYRSIYTLTATAERCLQSFAYLDAAPLPGMNYYRLRMTDADGRSTYSQTIALLNKDKGFEIVSLSPNPARANATLSLSSAVAGKIDIVITNIEGKIVSRQSVSFTAGSNLIPLQVANLASGSYQLTGSLPGGEIRSIRFIKD